MPGLPKGTADAHGGDAGDANGDDARVFHGDDERAAFASARDSDSETAPPKELPPRG